MEKAITLKVLKENKILQLNLMMYNNFWKIFKQKNFYNPSADNLIN